MKKICLQLATFLICSVISAQQSCNLTFKGNMDALQKVKVININKGTTLTINNTDTLHLTSTTGLFSISENNEKLKVFPNPFLDETTISIINPTTGNAKIVITELSGKIIYSMIKFLSVGENKFTLSGLKKGVYFINISTSGSNYSNKILSLNTKGLSPAIQSALPITTYVESLVQRSKNFTNAISDMVFDPGDLFSFIGYGTGSSTDTITATPTADNQYIFEFHAPNSKTVGEMINALPDTYSLFKSIMAETKLIDTLSADNGMWYTAILQSDSTFHSQGINSKSDLIEKMKIAQPDYALDENKLLLLFAQYHCINRLAYVNDLCITEATLAYNQIITCKSTNDSVILNEFKTLNSFEKGITINKQSQWTDKGCVNGVLIDVKSYLQPVKRNAFAVNWEFTEQPEIKRLKEYRKPGSLVTFKPGELSELNFGGKNNPLITYVALTTWDPKAQYVHGDYFDIPIRPVVLQWMEMKTPVLAEGTYNIWIAFRRSSTSGNTFKTTFIQDGKDNQVLPYTIDMSLYFNTSATPEANLAEGAKRYMAKQSNSVMGAKLLGSVKVEKAGRHSLRFESLTGGSGTTWWDLIQFIPVNENQLWPRFDSAGQSIFPGTYCNLIAPFEQICSGDLNN